jgi:hypothetical protein
MGDKGEKPAAFDTEKFTNSIQGAAHQQMMNNRPDVVTPWSKQTWQTGPDGRMTQSTQLTGGVGQAVNGIMDQIGSRGQMNWGQFGNPDNGNAIRDKTTEAAYGLGAKRLDDRFGRGQESLEVKLANQGLTPGTEAYDAAMKTFGNERTDAYDSLSNSSYLAGQQAGSSAFRDNMSAHQQSIAQALQKHNQPMADLQGLSGFLAPMGFVADNSTASGAQAAAGNAMAGQNQNFNQWQSQQFDIADALGAVGSLGGAFFSDERVKMAVRRLSSEMLPGVPHALFVYKEGFGAPGVHLGVIAQDLVKVRPDLVLTDPETGFYKVDYGSLRKAIQ